MKKLLILVASLFILSTSCSPKKTEEDTNKVLYNQVMDIHDEVMPSMDELYKLKKQLTEKIENSPDLVEEKRQEIEQTILLIDSASKGMMRWMREFKPEEYKEVELTKYLESEMKRVQTVKETMQDALVQGREATKE
ncbi:MAG: hypothetical protein KF725_11655 [Cyclobacteriaceae bacterium]|nr:hypothetical protein [Cyclobacteriaceae bacterium]UYN86356.1 MAG: hypothetical protein KIT51_16050 [Cyclobacteriaceae bacterium]